MINLDVVIVNWNAREQLLDCLQALQDSCSGSDFNLSSCVIVDNASFDGSIDKLAGLSINLKVVKNLKNMGFAFACNQGAKYGTSEYLLFLNPDIKLFRDSLTKALLFMNEPQNNQIGILGIQLLDADGKVQRNAARFPTPASMFYQMLGLDQLWPSRFQSSAMADWDHAGGREVDQVQGAFFLVRRSLFEELQGFDGRFFMYYEDVDFANRARQAGWRSYYQPEAQAFHRGGGTSDRIKAKRLFYWMTSRLKYTAKHFGNPAAGKILVSSLLFEFWARVGKNILHRSGRHLIETIQAYAMLIRTLPQLLREISSMRELGHS
jgi:N-acetylglucosaminyl-diphospho-decaprenol L-rhamnosyltransferase